MVPSGSLLADDLGSKFWSMDTNTSQIAGPSAARVFSTASPARCCALLTRRGLAVGRRQLIQSREAQIPAVHADSNQRLPKEILLGLADGDGIPVVNHKYLESPFCGG